MKWPLLACMISILLTACGSVGPQAAARTIPLSGTPNGIAVRPDGTILITDDSSNSIQQSSGDDPFTRFATLPPVQGARNGLSQIATGPGGNVFVERFGFGTASAIFRIDETGLITLASDTHPERRRLGLAVLSSTGFLSSWFVKAGNDPAQGGISRVTLDPATGRATERDLVTGLVKPVGIAVVGDTLYIADQAANRIVETSLRIALSASAPVHATEVFASVTSPDLLAASADGTLYTKCGDHALCRFSTAGQATVIANDFDEPRGVAIDPTRKRLLAVDRGGEGRPSHLRILPID